MSDKKQPDLKNLKDIVEAKQVSDNSMVIYAEIDGQKIYHKQDVKDVELNTLERKARIVLANTIPTIKVKQKQMESKETEIAAKIGNVRSGGVTRD